MEDANDECVRGGALVLGLVGKKRSGKDTVADWLKDNHGFAQYAMADPLKQAAKAMFLFSDEQLYGDEKEDIDPRWGISARKVLQILGTELIRQRFMELAPEVGETIKAGFWVHRFKLWYKQWRRDNPDTPLVLSDLRFQDEVSVVLQVGGVVAKIERDTGAANRSDAHKTEQVDDFEGISWTIDNNGTLEELYARVATVLEEATPHHAEDQ